MLPLALWNPTFSSPFFKSCRVYFSCGAFWKWARRQQRALVYRFVWLRGTLLKSFGMDITFWIWLDFPNCWCGSGKGKHWDLHILKRLIWLKFSTNFRYTLFIFLYPIGITGELICIYYSLDFVKQKKMWTYSMPNALNVTFDYQYALILVMLSYIPSES